MTKPMTDQEWSAHYDKVTATPAYKALRGIILRLRCIIEADAEVEEAKRKALEAREHAREEIKNLMDQLCTAAIKPLPADLEDDNYVLHIAEEWYEYKDILDAITLTKPEQPMRLFKYAEINMTTEAAVAEALKAA